MVAVADALARVVAPLLPRAPSGPPKDVLVLRLDRIGDVLMSLPALHALRAALPGARIRLAVGEWSRDIARDAPVDEVLVWSAPWVGRRHEGAATAVDLFKAAGSLRSRPPDLAIDLQGDLRAIWLIATTGARARIGYANTGSAAFLTSVVDLNEDVNFVEQNYRAIETAIGASVPRRPFRWLHDDDERRTRGRARLAAALSAARIHPAGPLIGIHPGAGRSIKEWPIDRYVALSQRLVAEKSATLVLTGSESEKALTAVVARTNPTAILDLAGELDLQTLAEVMSGFDAFVSGDTSAMHFACALGVPSVAIFGPSDPSRYFSGGALGFGSTVKHIALSPRIWCSPCNLIRRPPEECERAPAPECLTAIDTGAVFDALSEVLAPA